MTKEEKIQEIKSQTSWMEEDLALLKENLAELLKG